MSGNTVHGYAGAYFQTNDAEVITSKIHGVRFPDGTIRWDQNGTSTAASAAKNDVGRAHWVHQLKERAKELHLDPEEFAAGHGLVTRTVIISATAAEEV